MREKHLDFEVVFFDPRKSRPPELEALGSRAKSPTLFDGDTKVHDSLVVVEYLEDRYHEHPLLPHDPAARANVRMFITRVSDELMPKFGAVTMAVLKRDDAAKATAMHELADALPVWDRALANRMFAVGDTFSLADIVLYTQFPASKAFAGFEPPPELAHLRGWLDRMAARPGAAVLRAP